MSDSPSSRVVPVRRVGVVGSNEDTVVVEEPLEIRLGDERLLVTMRTPGDDFDLVRGLLFTDSILPGEHDAVGFSYCDRVAPEEQKNVIVVGLREGLDPRSIVTQRLQIASAACGVCGRRSLEEIGREAPPVTGDARVTANVLSSLPAMMRSSQTVFASTGGLHAAALFDPSGRLLVLKEDIGRHNAVDKVIGAVLRFGLLPLEKSILLVSGRGGFEIAHKARRAGIPILACVSAPSSLAVEVCREGGMTLVGFLRGASFNIYCGEQRIES